MQTRENIGAEIAALIAANKTYELAKTVPFISSMSKQDKALIKSAVSDAMRSNKEHPHMLSILLEKGVLTKDDIYSLVIETFNITNLIKANNLIGFKTWFDAMRPKLESYDYHVYLMLKKQIAREAILTGREDIVKFLLDLKFLDLDKDDIHTIRAEIHFEKVSHLVKENKIEELKALFAAHPEFKNDWNITNNFVVAAATRDAIFAGHEEMVKLVLDAGLKPNAIAPDDKSAYFSPCYGTRTLIYFAANSGQLNMVTLLIERGAKIYATEEDRNWIAIKVAKQALEGAVRGGHIHIVNDLLARGADANGECEYNVMDSNTYLGHATEMGHIVMVETLVKHRADIPLTLALAHDKYERGMRDLIDAEDRQVKELQLTNTYTHVVKTCLDYATGCNFDNLNFLNGLNVSGMNFRAMTLQGKPITPEDIQAQNTHGVDLMKKRKPSVDLEKGIAEKLATLGLHSSPKAQSSGAKDHLSDNQANSYKKN